MDTTISIWDIGYARLGKDFTVETLTIPQGGTSGTATLKVIDDDLYEDTEEIRIQAAKTGYKISPVLKIQLEDNEQKLRLAVSPGQVSEPSGTAQVTVSVAKAIEADAVVTLHRNGTAASGSDYTLAQTATILAGETSAPATTLQVVDNTIYEGAKTIELQARATGYGDSDPVKVDLADDGAAAADSDGGHGDRGGSGRSAEGDPDGNGAGEREAGSGPDRDPAAYGGGHRGDGRLRGGDADDSARRDLGDSDPDGGGRWGVRGG